MEEKVVDSIQNHHFKEPGIKVQKFFLPGLVNDHIAGSNITILSPEIHRLNPGPFSSNRYVRLLDGRDKSFPPPLQVGCDSGLNVGLVTGDSLWP